jgi:hypothetical protein
MQPFLPSKPAAIYIDILNASIGVVFREHRIGQ